MRKVILVLIVVVAIAAIVLPFGYTKLSGHRLELRAYFEDAGGLRAGAPVRLAGVDIGIVKSVRVRPEMREHPAEVIMVLNTPYDLKIPSDSMVTLSTTGVLGEPFPEIDVRAASGHPAQNGAVLKARSEPTQKDLLHGLQELLQRKACGDEASAAPTPDGKRTPERKR